MIAKDFVPPWARGDFDYYQVAVCRSITLYGTHPRGRPTSPESSQPAKERGRRAILLVRVDSDRGQNRTLRGMAPVECAIDGWSRDGEGFGEIADGILAGGMHAAEFLLPSVAQFGLYLPRNSPLFRAMAMPARVRIRMRSASHSAKVARMRMLKNILPMGSYGLQTVRPRASCTPRTRSRSAMVGAGIRYGSGQAVEFGTTRVSP